MDGISLLPILEKPELSVERQLFWRMKFRDQKAMRAGAWKRLSIEGDEFLFDLSKDERERANLAKRAPDRLAAMKKRYLEWEATMPPVPADAAVSLAYTRQTMAQPS